MAADYPELLEPDAPEVENGSTTAAGGYGRSHLRRRTDGPGKTLRIRALPTDEWAVLSQNNAEVVESARIAPLAGIERVTQTRLSGSDATALVQCQPEVCVHGTREVTCQPGRRRRPALSGDAWGRGIPKMMKK